VRKNVNDYYNNQISLIDLGEIRYKNPTKCHSEAVSFVTIYFFCKSHKKF